MSVSISVYTCISLLFIRNAYLLRLMFYITTPKHITMAGRKWILAVGTEVKKLGLDDGDDVIVYIMRPEDELSMDMLIQKAGSKFYLLISENPDIIVARSLSEAKDIASETEKGEHIVVGSFTNQSKALRYKRIILDELKKGLPREEKAIQERLDKLLQYD